MDLVVWLAIGTLLAVFILAASVLVALLWRRRQQNNARRLAGTNFIYTRDDKKVDDLIELVPLLDGELANCGWATGVHDDGPFSDVVAILKLTTEVVKMLSGVSVLRTSTKVYEVIAQSMFRVNTHFHELLEFTPAKEQDLRVIEARALTLTTTVWSLNAAFTLHGIDETKEKEVEEKVIKMYQHVDSLRQHCLAIDKKDGEEIDDEEDDKAASQSTEETTSGTVMDGQGENVIITHSDLPSPPSSNVTIAEVHETEIDDTTALLKEEEKEATLLVPPSSPSKPASIPIIPTANGSPPKIESANGTSLEESKKESNPPLDS